MVTGSRVTGVPGSSRRGAWHVAATTVIWVTSLVVAALWVSGGGVQALFSGSAETLNTLGRLAGLVSANLLLYQVLLMARVPIFERGFGREGITRMHRTVCHSDFLARVPYNHRINNSPEEGNRNPDSVPAPLLGVGVSFCNSQIKRNAVRGCPP